jgi:aromatic-L-amino-acid/L-tryptophan decarboxylase
MDPLEISPEDFRELAAEVAQFSTDWLASLDDRATFPPTTGAETERLFATELPRKGLRREALAGLQQVADQARVHNGRFYGYVQPPGEPVAALGDFVASILNQNMTAWRSSPAGITIERTVVRWLAEAIGCKGFYGTLTGGGSAANLMGLTMAREARLSANERGLRGCAAGAVYASSEVHMAVPKAVAMVGLGRENLRTIACDANYRMVPAELERAIRADKAQGIVPVAVVVSAGTVNTGAIDPLREIAEIAHAHGAWVHVDGAYGALATLAIPEKFDGLAQADSITLDPHKWLYQPLDCGCLLYRDLDVARKTFAYTGDYAKNLHTDPIEAFAYFEESIELSRRCRGLKLWLSLRYHGLNAFRAAIQKDLDLTRRLAANVAKVPILETVGKGDLSVVCFRHLISPNATEEERNRFNLALVKRVIRRGKVYPSYATLEGKFCLRFCVVNHLTKESDIDAVVPEVLEAAGEIRADV